jgi:3-oxoacyl-[acyl-carrier-protein] synthase-3
VALVDAIEEGRVKPGSLMLMPGFGGGLTLCSHLVKWGDRVTPLATTTADLPTCTRSALEMVNDIRVRKHAHDTSEAGLMAPRFAEADTAS